MALSTARKAVGKLLGPAGASTNGAEQQLYHDGGSTKSTAHLLGYLLRADADCCSEAGHSWCLGPGLHRAEACVAVVDADAATPEAVTGGWVVFIDGGWCRAPAVSSECWRSGLWNNAERAQRRLSVHDCNVATVGPGPPGNPGQCAATRSGGGTRIGIPTGSCTGTGTAGTGASVG